MQNLIFSAFIVFMFAGTGGFFLQRLFRLNSLDTLERLLTGFGLGYGLYGILLFVLGLCGLLNPFSIFLLVLVGAVLTIVGIKPLLDSGIGIYHALKNERSHFEKALFWLMVLFFANNLIVSLAPISHYDAVFYHFELPRQYLSAGRIFDIEGYLFSHSPQLAQMINAMAMALCSDISASVLNSFFSLFTALLIYAGGRRFCDERSGFLGAVLYYCSPLAAWTATGNFVDPHLGFFALLSVYLLFLYLQGARKRLLVFSGAMMGFAFSIKLLAVGFFAAANIVFLYLFLKPKGSRLAVLKDHLIWLMPVAAFGTHWYIFNFINTGNPLYPLFYSVFGGKSWNPALEKVLLGYHEVYGVGKSLASFLALPSLLTFEGDLFFNGRFIGPLFMTFIPFSYFAAIHRRAVLVISFLTFAYVSVWFVGSQQARFLLPILPLLCILAAVGLLNLERAGSKAAAMAAWGALVIFLILSVKTVADYSLRFYGAALDQTKREDFLKERVPGYATLDWMNNNLKSQNRVLFLGLGHYYMDIPYLEGGYGIQGVVDYDTLKTQEKLRQRLKSLGITHIYRFSLYPHLPPKELFAGFESSCLEKLHEEGWKGRGTVDGATRIGVGTVYRLK